MGILAWVILQLAAGQERWPQPGQQGQRAAQWASYELEVRAAFLKERRRFHGDIERIEKEMQQAAEAQEQARAKVRLAAQGSASLERPTSEEPAWDGADPWLELTADADEDPPAEDAALQEVLARAFSGAQGQGLSQGSLEGMAPSTPPSRLLPRTPKAAVPKGGGKAPGTASASTRLIPFPPPKRPKLGPAADDDVNMQTAYASEDPYQRVVDGHGAPADTLASPPLKTEDPQSPFSVDSESPVYFRAGQVEQETDWGSANASTSQQQPGGCEYGYSPLPNFRRRPGSWNVQHWCGDGLSGRPCVLSLMQVTLRHGKTGLQAQSSGQQHLGYALVRGSQRSWPVFLEDWVSCIRKVADSGSCCAEKGSFPLYILPGCVHMFQSPVGLRPRWFRVGCLSVPDFAFLASARWISRAAFAHHGLIRQVACASCLSGVSFAVVVLLSGPPSRSHANPFWLSARC